MASKDSIITTGLVEHVEGTGSYALPDEVGGRRIKVRLDTDGDRSTADLPWAFPLDPKFIQCMPKVGEGVFVVYSNIGEPDTQRYFMGPIISQAQYQEFCNYGLGGRGPALSLITASKPLTEGALASIDRKKELTKGSFPDLQDIALIGRGQEDIVLKYRNTDSGSESEVDLRAGIRLEPSDTSIKYMRGNVVFNSLNPGYIQVKYAKNGVSGLRSGSGDNDVDKYEDTDVRMANSVVNIVADKVNLISHKDNNSFGNTIANNEDLIKSGELDEIMSRLHRSVYGDELVALLKMIVSALVTHTHPYSMLPPTVKGTALQEIVNYDYENVLSPNVRIS